MAPLRYLVGALALLMLIDNIICQSDKRWQSHIRDVGNQNLFHNGKHLVKRSTHHAGDYSQGPSENQANMDDNANVKRNIDEKENVERNIDEIFNIPTNHRHRKRRQSIGLWPVGIQNPNWFFNSAQRFTQPPRNFPTFPQPPRDIYGGFYDAFNDPAIEQSGSRFPNVYPKEYPQLNNFFFGQGLPRLTPWRINSQWFSPLFFIPVYCNLPYLPPRAPDGGTTVGPPVQPSVNMTLDDRFGTDRNWGPVDPTTRRPILPNVMNNAPQPAILNNPNEIGKLPPANPDGEDDDNYTIREISFEPVQPSRQPSITPPPVEHGKDAPAIPQASASASAFASASGINNIVGGSNANPPDENAIIPPQSSNPRPSAQRPVLPASRTPPPPRRFVPNVLPQARPPQPQVTSTPRSNMREQPSPCVLAIISCCVPNSEKVQDDCFENFGCGGPFWDRSPCNSEIARTAITVFRQLNARFSTGSRPPV